MTWAIDYKPSEEGHVTYQTLFKLKFEQKVPTLELEKKFPRDKEKISRLALLELPAKVLKSVVRNEKELFHLQSLKRALFSPK